MEFRPNCQTCSGYEPGYCRRANVVITPDFNPLPCAAHSDGDERILAEGYPAGLIGCNSCPLYDERGCPGTSEDPSAFRLPERECWMLADPRTNEKFEADLAAFRKEHGATVEEYMEKESIRHKEREAEREERAKRAGFASAYGGRSGSKNNESDRQARLFEVGEADSQ